MRRVEFRKSGESRQIESLAAAVSTRDFELIQASFSKEEIDHSKPIYLNCYCDSYRKIQGLKKNAFSSQSKYSKDLMNGAFMKNKDIHHIHRAQMFSLFLSVIFLSLVL